MPRRFFRPLYLPVPALLAALALAACGGGARLPQAFPTSAALPGAAAAEVTPGPDGQPVTPPPGDSGEPVLVLPGAGGVSVACEANTLRLPLAVAGQPAGAASRLVAADDMLFVVADGALYRLPIAAAVQGTADLEPVLGPGERIGGPLVQELVDLAYSPADGLLFVLDKAGHLYRVDAASAQVALDYRATDDPDMQLTSQMVGVTVDDRGEPVLLDAAFGALWTPADLQSLDIVGQSDALDDSVDVAYLDGRFYVLRHDGSLVTVNQPTGSSERDSAAEPELALSLAVSDHLGVRVLTLVDALRREISALQPGSGEIVTRHVLGFPDAGLLRDAVFAEGRLFALADGDLYVFPGPAPGAGEATCPPPSPGSFARPRLYGRDILAELGGWEFPVRGGSLPPWPHLYPGGSRIYRQGVHRGLDLYHWEVPTENAAGTHILAPAAGRVSFATTGYVPMTASEFDRLVGVSQAVGETPPEVLQRFGGITVELDHGSGLRTAYQHLGDTAEDIATGMEVEQRQLIGEVGATGTEGEAYANDAAAHLHFEIWIGDRFLGQGITLRETMWWFEQIFGG